jgi:hypothetical protein
LFAEEGIHDFNLMSGSAQDCGQIAQAQMLASLD